MQQKHSNRSTNYQFTTDFVTNFVYEDGQLAHINTPEGRIVYNTNGTIRQEFNLKDHLGNVRVVYSVENGVVTTRQIDNYYPFGYNIKGLSVNKYATTRPNEYLYNGKMMQDEMGLNWLDYGARMYDAALGRWHVIDPLAEKHPSINPFAYCANNPIILIDPNGMTFTGSVNSVNRAERYAKTLVKREQNKQARLWKRAERRESKGKNSDRQYDNIEKSIMRECQYQSTANEIDEMRRSPTIYDINTMYNPQSMSDPDGYTEFVGKDSKGNSIIRLNISISYLANGGLYHELVHGYQFEIGQLDFEILSHQPGLLYDIFDEVNAFKRQFAFTKNTGLYNLTPSRLLDFAHSCNPPRYAYDRLPQYDLNVNTPAGLVVYYSGKGAHWAFGYSLYKAKASGVYYYNQ